MVSDKEFWTWLKNGRCALYVFEIDEKTGKKIYRPGGRQDARSYYNQLSNTPEINEWTVRAAFKEFIKNGGQPVIFSSEPSKFSSAIRAFRGKRIRLHYRNSADLDLGDFPTDE